MVRLLLGLSVFSVAMTSVFAAGPSANDDRADKKPLKSGTSHLDPKGHASKMDIDEVYRLTVKSVNKLPKNTGEDVREHYMEGFTTAIMGGNSNPPASPGKLKKAYMDGFHAGAQYI